MTENDDQTTEDEKRAERIKKLRRGEPVARRERRKPRVPEPVEEVADPADVDVDVDHDGPMQPDEDLELPDDANRELTVASMYLTRDLRRMLERQEKHLHLRYGMQYDVDIYGPRHIRPLAMYLGVRQLERVDLEDVHGLFANIDEVESPK